MPISKYLTTFSHLKNQNELLVFSTKTTSKTIVNKDQYEKIKFEQISSENRQLLTKLGLLVKDQGVEKKQITALFDRINEKNTTLTVTIVLNLDCNFACTYCYEEGVKDAQYMSRETADELIAFIEQKLTPDKKSLVVDFYGGEPLLSQKRIEYISQKLVDLTQTRGILFSSTMITNGSLLKRPVAKKLAAMGLKMVKVTLDGPAKIHDKYRPFKSGSGSFDILIKNIKDCLDVVHFNIGGNYDQTSYPDFVSLLDELERHGLTRDKLSIVKFDPITETSQPGISMSELRGGCLCTNEPWLLEAEKLLRSEILKLGYKTPKVQTAFCAVENNDAFVVNYNGDVYKCPGFIGNKAFVVGHISGDIKDYREMYKLDIWKNDECITCVYLPLCYGGCRYMTYLRHNRIDTVDCRRDYYDAQLETLVKQDIEFKENVV